MAAVMERETQTSVKVPLVRFVATLIPPFALATSVKVAMGAKVPVT